MLTITHSINHRILQWSLATSAAFGIIASLPAKTMAITGFTGNYATPGNWSFTYNETNITGTTDPTSGASIDYTNAANGTIVLTGSNDESGNSGTTDWTIPITASGAAS